MPVRMTVEISEPLHTALRHRAQQSGVSIRALTIRALEQAYCDRKKGDFVTGPSVTGGRKLGPRFPKDENPHDFVFS